MYEIDEDGNSVFVLEGDGSYVIINDWEVIERVYIGVSFILDFLGFFFNSLNYKGFFLNFLFIFGIGGDILDNGYFVMMYSGVYGCFLYLDILDVW